MATVIVGSGVTGLTIAERLLAAERDVTVLERESVVGGLCRSYHYGDFVFDIGPHRLFSSNPEIHDYFLDILGDAYSVISRESQVHMNGKYLNWPLSLGSVLRMPMGQTLNCVVDLLRRNGAKNGDKETLESYIVERYGPTIFETFWKGYTEKFLGVPCDEVDAIWGQLSVGRSIVDRRMEPHGLLDLAKNCLLPKKQHVEFLYPKHGMDTFPERFADRIRARKGNILLSQQIDRIETGEGAIKAVHAGDQAYAVDDLVWTGSLPEICRLLGEPVPEVQYLSTLLYNLEIDTELPGEWQWVYYPDSGCQFSRISRPSLFGAETVPAGKTGLCVEVSCVPGMEAETMEDRVISDLVRVGLIPSKDRVQNCHLERVPNTYPIYRLGFREQVEAAHKRLMSYHNLYLAGRQAVFVHDNIDEAVEVAQQTADAILRPVAAGTA